MTIKKKKVYKAYLQIYYTVLSWVDPVPWVIDKNCKSILDVACGQGNPMRMIKKRMKVDYAVGVDIFKPYLDYCKKEKIFNKLITQDVRKIKFLEDSFDIVLLNEIVEHLTKKEAWELIKKAEKVAKYQVVIATPIGKSYHPAVDGNKYQLHKSAFYPKEFVKRGYKVKKYGWKKLLDEHTFGVARTMKKNLISRRIFYITNLLLTPVYYVFQDSCDYIFVAYKDVSKH